MALDVHRLDNNEFLFAFEHRQFNDLEDIFTMFTQWTGLIVDEYDDSILTTENQETLIRVIDKYIDTADLNKDKRKISTILEFKGMLRYFRLHKIDLRLFGE